MKHMSVSPLELLLLDKVLLNEDGLPKILPAATYNNIPHELLQAWTNIRGIYQVITKEQVEWTKMKIADRSAIEICAGYGTLGRALQIPFTDVKLQEDESIASIYRKHKTFTINYPKDVIKMEAIEAIRHYRPQVVIGCFVTQWGSHEMPLAPSSPYGPKEWEFFDEGVETYINFGNKAPHFNKRLYAMPHEELWLPWLVTRCNYPNLNRVWIFNKK